MFKIFVLQIILLPLHFLTLFLHQSRELLSRTYLVILRSNFCGYQLQYAYMYIHSYMWMDGLDGIGYHKT